MSVFKRTIFLIFSVLIFSSCADFTYAYSFDQNFKKVTDFYKESSLSLFAEIKSDANNIKIFFTPLFSDVSRNLVFVFDDVTLSGGMFLRGMYNTGLVVSSMHIYGIESVGTTLEKGISSTAYSLTHNPIAHSLQKTPKVLSSLAKVPFFVGESFIGATDHTLNTTGDFWGTVLFSTQQAYKKVDDHFYELNDGLGSLGYNFSRNVFALASVPGETILSSHISLLEKTGDFWVAIIRRGGAQVQKINTKVATETKSFSSSTVAGVGFLWDSLIDKISEPLVPLFEKDTVVNIPVTKKQSKNSIDQSQNNSSIDSQGVQNITSVSIKENPSLLNSLRQEFYSLNESTLSYLKNLISLQNEKVSEGVYKTILRTSSGSSSSVSGSATLSSLVFGSSEGILIADNTGSVSVSNILSLSHGGTGTSTSPSYGQVLLGNSSGGYDLVATSTLGLGGISSAVTSINISVPTGLTVSGGPITSSGTISLGIESGYTIPLSASTTEWSNAYNNRIVSVTGPLSFASNTLSFSTSGDWTGTFDGQEGSYYLNAQNLSNFGVPFYTYFSATTTDALAQGSTNKYYTSSLFNTDFASKSTTNLSEGTNLYFTNGRAVTALTGQNISLFTNDANYITSSGAPVQSVFGRNGSVTAQSGDYNTSQVTESGNLYFTTGRVASVIAGTTTDALLEGSTNQYFTNVRADARVISVLSATTSINSITTLSNLLLPATQLSNFGVPFYTYFSATTTDALAQGSTNKYYSSSLFNTDFASKSTTNLSEGTNLYFTDERVNSYIHASSTIPKTYTSNTFTGNNVFNGSLTFSSFNGPLQANNGVLSATSSIGVLYGGTGLVSAPSYGNILVGNSSGGYTLTATSSLGITSSQWTTSGSSINYSTGNVGIGTSTPYGRLAINDDTSQSTGLNIVGNVNGFFQANIQNTSSGASASSDWVATANNGDDTTHYVDFGINGSGGATTPFTTANHAYLYSISDTLNIGALGTGNNIQFYTTGGTSPVERMRLNSSGNLGIGTTTPFATLAINPTAGAASNQFVVGSSTATSFLIDNGGRVGIGTTSPTFALAVSGTEYISGTSTLTKITAASTTFDFRLPSTVSGYQLRYGVGSDGGVKMYNAGNLAGSSIDFRGNNSTILISGATLSGTFFSGAQYLTTPWLGSTNSSGNDVSWVISKTGNGGGQTVYATTQMYGTNANNGPKLLIGANGIDFATRDNSSWNETYDTIAMSIASSTAYVGVGTTTPWRKLSVTGTVGFSSLTGSTGAGSLCLSSNNEVVYNSGSDSCLPSLRETKHDITDLTLSASDIISSLNSVSFIYNTDASSTVRYGFIAEDTAQIDPHLATYDAKGKISGIDDRAVISVLVKAFKELKQSIDRVLTWFGNDGSQFNVQGDICVDDVCVTKEEFKELLLQNRTQSQTGGLSNNNTENNTNNTFGGGEGGTTSSTTPTGSGSLEGGVTDSNSNTNTNTNTDTNNTPNTPTEEVNPPVPEQAPAPQNPEGSDAPSAPTL